MLQTSVNSCIKLVLHPLGNVQPVQLAKSAVVLPCVADDAIMYITTAQ